MFVAEYSKHTTASATDIWALWSDVSNWNKWDKSVEYSRLNGSFTPYSYGILKPKGGPKSKFILLEVVPNKKFTDSSSLPFAKIIFSHEIIEAQNGRVIKHTVEMKGAFSWIFNKILGKTFRRDLPEAVNKLVKMAESR